MIAFRSLRWITILTRFLCVFSTEDVIIHERREDILRIGENGRRLHPSTILPIRIGLRQNPHALEDAEIWLMSVSDPLSRRYGQHWSTEDVTQAFRPTTETVEDVTQWLHSNGITRFARSDNQQWVAFDLGVEKAEALFHTKYFEYEDSNGGTEVGCNEYYLPGNLARHIDYITPCVKGIASSKSTSNDLGREKERSIPSKYAGNAGLQRRRFHPPMNDTSLVNCSFLVTPACIRALYNFSTPDPSVSMSENNRLGIFEADDNLYYQGDLDRFYKHFAPHIPAGTGPYFDAIDDPMYPPNRTRGKNWLFVEGESNLDLQCAIPIIYPQNAAVYEIGVYKYKRDNGLDFYPHFLDAIDGSYCTTPQKTNSSEGLLPQCGIFKPTNVISISWGSPEHKFTRRWMERQCLEYLKLGLQGVSLFFCSQDWGVNGIGPDERCRKGDFGPRVFMPSFPASCPWVTSVGATEIAPHNSVQDPEHAAKWFGLHHKYAWGDGSSGGGFSLHFDAPAYQRDAIKRYFDISKTPWKYFYNGDWQNSTGRYNRNGRGFPDISAVGTHIATYNGNDFFRTRGTSASTPIVAALFNRIIEERIRAGKGPLGFVNPALYQHPALLNDITIGGNGYCLPDEGFECAAGWDPVTGWGTPNYPKLLDAFMHLP